MNRLPLKLAMVVAVSSLPTSIPAATQVSPATNEASDLRITQGPEIERADPDFAIIRWATNNPGGSPEHFGVVLYGTAPSELNQSAKSPIRLNPGHSQTIFRVRLDGLKPGTAYYYRVDSIEATGKRDGVKSPVKRFAKREDARLTLSATPS